MIRNLKVLGSTVLILLTASAVTATGAQATGEGAFTSSSGTYPLNLNAESNEPEKFTMFGQELTCLDNTYSGVVSAASTSVTIMSEWATCHTPGPLGITLMTTVTFNTCDFGFYHATTDLNDFSGKSWNLTTEIDCENPSDVIEAHVYTSHAKHTTGEPICTKTITQQTVANGPTATNNADGSVTLRGGTTGLHVESHNSSSLCPENSGTKTSVNGVLDLAAGGLTFSGKTDPGNPNPFHIK
jgi:hypothetical protein